jgi:hypothetical protein
MFYIEKDLMLKVNKIKEIEILKTYLDRIQEFGNSTLI